MRWPEKVPVVLIMLSAMALGSTPKALAWGTVLTQPLVVTRTLTAPSVIDTTLTAPAVIDTSLTTPAVIDNTLAMPAVTDTCGTCGVMTQPAVVDSCGLNTLVSPTTTIYGGDLY